MRSAASARCASWRVREMFSLVRLSSASRAETEWSEKGDEHRGSEHQIENIMAIGEVLCEVWAPLRIIIQGWIVHSTGLELALKLRLKRSAVRVVQTRTITRLACARATCTSS